REVLFFIQFHSIAATARGAATRNYFMNSDFRSLNIAVVAGGPGSERRVSLASGEGVVEALRKRCDHVQLVDVTEHEVHVPDGIDLAFNVIHGTYGEDGEMQSELDAKGVAYTGAGAKSSRLAFDKIKSKERFKEKGVRTPSDQLQPTEKADSSIVEFPCVVKPPREGSSVGVHIVHNQEEWDAAVEDCAKYTDTLLIEQYVKGKELTVGVLGGEALPIIHIQPRSGFYDINNKYPWMDDKGGTDYFCPADLSDDLSAKIQAEALKAHDSLGIEVYSRVDLLLDESDQFYVLEVNTIPGMTASSLLPKAARAVGIEFDELCVRIAEASLELRSKT
ncbi:MAG: D-alanine--D-alanine ligase, partial [Verrucomicrobiota bacterium]